MGTSRLIVISLNSMNEYLRSKGCATLLKAYAIIIIRPLLRI